MTQERGPGHRIVEGLRWAKPGSRPAGLPIGRPRGAKALGIRYERAIAKAMPQASPGLWWQFEDKNGLGWCQTDFVIDTPQGVWVLEAKYTWTARAHSQLERLYLPVLRMALGRPVRGIVICKALSPEMTRYGALAVRAWLTDAAAATLESGRPAVLHWLGVAPGPLRLGPEARPLALGASPRIRSTIGPGSSLELL